MKKTATVKLSEADVTKQVVDFMKWNGWRAIRNNVGGMMRGKRYIRHGEKGMADWTFWKRRFSDETRPVDRMIQFPPVDTSMPERHPDFYRAQVWRVVIEFKAPGKELEPHQIDWHEAERALGALVKVFDNYENFKTWYEGVFR